MLFSAKHSIISSIFFSNTKALKFFSPVQNFKSKSFWDQNIGAFPTIRLEFPKRP